ncbi:MAG: methyltransferase [Euryarchaeota archaeon]|nr:methyltransferase [Euryarchaeota archaeon]
MSSINKPVISPEPLDRMINGYRVSHILNTAVENGVFTRLSESKSKNAEEAAREMGTDPRTTEKFLNVLVTLGLLARSDGSYTNTLEAETFLVERKPNYIGNLVRITVGSNMLLSFLDEVLESGGSLQERLEDYTFDEVQILGHAEGALCHELPIIFDTLRDIPEFAGAKRILDLGGAHGAYSMAFARKDSVSEVTMFDRPHVIGLAKEFIAKHEMEDRIKLIAGDFNNDDLGNGYDLVFISHVFYQKEGMKSVLSKIYDSLDSNGAVILNHWVVNESRTGPRISVLFDLYASIMNRDCHVYTPNEYAGLLREAGFSNIRIFDIQTPPSPSMIVMGKKD